MTERENIFARIREALSISAPSPGAPHPNHRSPGATPSPAPHSGAISYSVSEVRQWLPLVGHAFEERLDLFRKHAAVLRADFHLVDNLDQLLGVCVGLRDTEQWKKVGSHSGRLTKYVVSNLELPSCTTDTEYQIADLESCSVGITECDALIAQTGSVLVTSRSAGGRALSVLPPHHVVLARREQLVADLPDAFTLLKRTYSPNYPSFISFITGPSRTGDIERILVLGAHGPRKLTIICL